MTDKCIESTETEAWSDEEIWKHASGEKKKE